MLMRTNRGNMPTLWNDNTTTSPLRMSDWIDDIFEDALSWPRMSSSTFVPELNVYETDKEFEVSVALPGINKDDVEISYNAGALTISGERKMQQENGRRYHRVESGFGKFTRSLPLPSDVVDQEKITAKYENGVLNVTVPKVKEKAAKKIKIT